MTLNDIKTYLCYYDLRNPDGINHMLKYVPEYQDDEAFGEYDDDTFGEHAKEDCGCDNCFYGRTQLAEELIKITNLYQIK